MAAKPRHHLPALATVLVGCVSMHLLLLGAPTSASYAKTYPRTGGPLPAPPPPPPLLLLEKPEPVREDPREHQTSSSHLLLRTSEVESEAGVAGQRRRVPSANGPLMLTPYLEAGDLQTARRLSEVGRIVDGLPRGHSGYFTVNKELGSHLFFWLVKSKCGNSSAPLLLWLNGGPGSSSLLGLLLEMGPLSFDADTLEPKLSSVAAWTDDFDVLFIDQPVGTGFSFMEDPNGFATTAEDYTNDLFEAVAQFFHLFPEYLTREFYATGISYAGRYIPHLAHRIHEVNQAGYGNKYPLTGIVTINGFTDPATVFLDAGEFLYQHGVLDKPGVDVAHQAIAEISQAIAAENWLGALMAISAVSDTESGLVRNLTGYRQIYNIGDPVWQGLPDYPYARYPDFVNQPFFRDAVHVGGVAFGGGYDVQAKLLMDLPQSARPKLEVLLDSGYKVLLLNGALDFVLGPRTCTAMLNQARWKYAEEYKTTPQELYEDDDGKVVGYLTKVHNLWQAKVLGGTHYAPANVPQPIYDILRDFIAADISLRV